MAEFPRESFLHDPVIDLPTIHGCVDQLETILSANNALGMLFLDLRCLNRVEEKFGTPTYEQVIRSISEVIAAMKGSVIRNSDVTIVESVGNPSPMVFLSQRRVDRKDSVFTRENVEAVADRVHEFVFPKIFKIVFPYLKERPTISVGFSYVVNNPLIAPRRQIYSLIEEAKQIAKLQQSRHAVRNKERLQKIIVEENVQTYFQPIVNMSKLEIVGYEALTRGPAGSEFESPLMLFALARETGLLFELDRLCRKKALQNARDLPKDKMVFVNTLPTTIHDPEFRGKYLQDFLIDLNLRPKNIVFEITEASAIEDYGLFKEAVEYYTDMGIGIAVDDTGTGYNTLETIMELRPQFIKFDISLVRNIDQSLLKRELVRAMMAIGKHMKATIVAEGIETRGEFSTLKSLGVGLGQGYLFAKPGPGFPTISDSKMSF